jgi:hypothetical protein
VTEDERTDEESASAAEGDDVEAHGAKKIVGTGLAAAALLGAGAAGVKLATDDDQSSQRVQGALTSRDDPVRALTAADRDGDGYLASAELAQESMKWDVAELNERGLEVSAPGLALAGFKQAPDDVGPEGFAIKGESIMLKQGVNEELDKLLDSGEAQEWSMKVDKLDRDGDGYALAEEFEAAGFRYDTTELEEAGIKVEGAELVKAGYKVPLHALGEGGFMIKGESIMLKLKVDSELDALLDKQ